MVCIFYLKNGGNFQGWNDKHVVHTFAHYFSAFFSLCFCSMNTNTFLNHFQFTETAHPLYWFLPTFGPRRYISLSVCALSPSSHGIPIESTGIDILNRFSDELWWHVTIYFLFKSQRECFVNLLFFSFCLNRKHNILIEFINMKEQFSQYKWNQMEMLALWNARIFSSRSNANIISRKTASINVH